MAPTSNTAGPPASLTVSYQVRPLSWRTGSEVVGLDLLVRDQLADTTIAALWQLLGERGILLFRGQVMDHDQHIAFTRRIGSLAKTGLLGRHAPAGYPDIFTVTNIKKDGQRSETENAAQQWHSDQSLLPAPARASLLRTSHTLFSTRSQRLSGRKAISSVSSEELERMKGHAHPAIRTHTDTGKKSPVGQRAGGRPLRRLEHRGQCVSGLRFRWHGRASKPPAHVPDHSRLMAHT